MEGNSYMFLFFNFIYLFIYFWLCWVFVSVQGLSLVVASGGHSSSRCAGLSLSWPLLLRSTGSRRAGSVIVAHRPSRSAACGIFPDQGSNLYPLHCQADAQQLHHQGSPIYVWKAKLCTLFDTEIPFLETYHQGNWDRSKCVGSRAWNVRVHTRSQTDQTFNPRKMTFKPWPLHEYHR